jgi:flagellar biosynthetic protein FliQ
VNVDLAVALANGMLITAMKVALPVLGVALVVGLLVSILQVVTSIQEMTLTFAFVPKILAVGAVMLLFGHWMLTTLANYSTALISNIPSYF